MRPRNSSSCWQRVALSWILSLYRLIVMTGWAARYAYLERQLETNGQKENGSSHKKEKKERREKSRDRDRDKDRKSSKREHKDGSSKERERKRHHSSHEQPSRTEKERKHRTPERRWVVLMRRPSKPLKISRPHLAVEHWSLHAPCTCCCSCAVRFQRSK